MRTCFLDTAYLIALAFERDENHALANAHWKTLRSGTVNFVTTSLILVEVAAYCASRHRHEIAVQIGSHLLSGEQVRFIHVDKALQTRGWKFFRDRPDKEYSLTDCVSFLIMEREGIREALTFDEHFFQAGFVRLPA